MSYPAYWLVEREIGKLNVYGVTDTRQLQRLTHLGPDAIYLYVLEMDCVKKGEKLSVPGKGKSPRELVRTALPGEICHGCGAVDHCILNLISGSEVNRKLLPTHLQNAVKV